ncbi:MAG: hypothetical protein ACKOEX_08880 [Planctomycetia bacterium]
MSRSLLVCGVAAALSFAFGSFAEAGHHRRHAEPGCAAEPACCAEPVGCTQFEPTCGCEPGCGAETCCPTNPCIKYRHKHACKHKCAKGCCEEPTYETVLCVTSPETCCSVNVPVCLPACCQGCPCETSRCTLFGCGQVRYDYACGCSVIVRFQHCGDILVTYVGF